jgi:hypothetical protein
LNQLTNQAPLKHISGGITPNHAEKHHLTRRKTNLIRSRKKSIALFVALIFALSIMMPMAAFADTTYGTYSGAYTFALADENQPAGTAKITEKGTWAALAGGAAIYAKVTLSDGVTYNTTPTLAEIANYAAIVGATGTFNEAGSNYLQVKLTAVGVGAADDSVEFKFNVADKSTLDIPSDFVGDVKATVEIFKVNAAGAIEWHESATQVIAKVASKGVAATVATAKTLSVPGGTAAEVTLTEAVPGSLQNNEVITMLIDNTDVTFNAATSTATGSQVAGAGVAAAGSLTFTVGAAGASTALPGKIVFAPVLNIPPSVTGDITVTVFSNLANSKLTKTTLKVATLGTASASVKKLKDNTGTCYAGGTKLLATTFDIEAVSGSSMAAGKYITLTLDKGTWDTAAPIVVAGAGGAGGGYQGKYNSDKTIWITIGAGGTTKLSLSSLRVAADADVAAGDITVTIGGDAGASGAFVIGQVKAPFSMSAEKPVVTLLASNQAAGDVVLTEAAAGALAATTVIELRAPIGFTFSQIPTMKVTSGNMTIDTKTLNADANTISFRVATVSSGSAATITISGIKYDVNKLALDGDVALTVKNAALSKAYGKVANATSKDSAAVSASFKVGDPGVAIVNNRTMVQVNTLDIGLQKSWDSASKTAYFVRDGKVVAFPIGENAIYIGGVKVPVDQGGVIINGATYVTLRGLEMAFGGKLSWDADTKTASFEF